MKPHQASLEISYDGTWAEAVPEAVEGSADSGTASYMVVKGDCLWSIAKRFYGNGKKYMEIYHANTAVIESTAKAHGKANSYKGSTAGWWIWPGEVLAIPGVSGSRRSRRGRRYGGPVRRMRAWGQRLPDRQPHLPTRTQPAANRTVYPSRFRTSGRSGWASGCRKRARVWGRRSSLRIGAAAKG